MKRKVEYTDLDKEILISGKPRNKKTQKWRGRFVLLNQDEVLKIVTTKHYTGTVYRVLLYFLSISDYGNRVPYLTQTQLAKSLKMTQPDVSAAIKILLADDILTKKEPYRDYYFCDDLFAKGSDDLDVEFDPEKYII